MQSRDEQILTRAKCWLKDCGFEFFINPNNNDGFIIKKNGYTVIWKPLQYRAVVFDQSVSPKNLSNFNPPDLAVYLRNI